MAETGFLKLSKSDVARRQVLAAIDLYFADGDPVSIHTLTSAAHGLVEDLAAKAGEKTPMHRTLVEALPKDLVEVVRKATREPQNFFKHADRDAGSILEFSPKVTDFLLLDAMMTFAKMDSEIPWQFEAFTKWFALHNPKWFENIEPWHSILRLTSRVIDPLKRQEYFCEYRASVERHEPLVVRRFPEEDAAP